MESKTYGFKDNITARLWERPKPTWNQGSIKDWVKRIDKIYIKHIDKNDGVKQFLETFKLDLTYPEIKYKREHQYEEVNNE